MTAPRVLADAATVAAVAATRFGDEARQAIATRGTFRVALAGGFSPAGMLRALWSTHPLEADTWARTTVLFADERAVPPDDPDSNYRRVREALLDPLGGDAPAAQRMRGEAADLEEVAREYEGRVAEPLDLIVLGVGEDGHVASLFPGSSWLDERVRRVGVVRDSPKPPAVRLTLLPRALAEARAVIVLATGGPKAEAVAAALAGAGEPARTPARLVRSRDWLIDGAAATRLGARPA